MDTQSLAEFFREKAGAILQGGLIEPVVWASLGAAGLKINQALKTRKQRKALFNATLGGATTLIGETHYRPTGEINPATGQEFYDQCIRNVEPFADLRHIFHPDVAEEIIKYIGLARGYCTMAEPVVFEHLEKVVPPEQFLHIQEIISKQWVNYFSKLLRKSYEPPPAGREVRNEIPILPVLVYEPDAKIKQYRVLLVPQHQLDEHALPAFEDTRFPAGAKGDFRHDPNSSQAARILTHHEIAKVMLENPWMHMTKVHIPVAGTRVIALPSATPEST